MPLVDTSPDAVDWGQPINWAHPLNRGRRMWLLGVPNRLGFGTTIWRDLCRRNNGVFGGGVSATSDWLLSKDPRYGWAAVNNAQVNTEEIDIGGFEIPAGTDFTFALTLQPDTYINTGGIWRNAASSGGSTFVIFNGAGGLPWMRQNGTDILKPGSGYVVPVGVYTRLVYTFPSGRTGKFFADGLLRHTATSTATQAAITGTDAIFNIGWHSSTDLRVPGRYDNITFWNRELSEAEVAHDFALLKRGYPGVLNRPSYRPAYEFIDAGGGGGNRRRRVIMSRAAG